MGRTNNITVKQAIKKVGRRLQGKIHIEDWIDIQNERKNYFNEVDITLKSLHDKPNECYKTLIRLATINRIIFKNRWNEKIIENFCDIEGLYDILQRNKNE